MFPEQIDEDRRELAALVALGLSDEEMEEALALLGCSYDGSDYPCGATEWVRSVRTRLE